MSRFPRIAMRMGLGMLAAGMAVSAHADAPRADGPAPPAAGQSPGSEPVAIAGTREKRLGTRIETVGTRMEGIIVYGGAVDRQNQRFVDSPAATAVLPTVSESAFLDDEHAGSVDLP